MRLDKITLRRLALLVAFGIALAWLFFNMDSTLGFFRFIWRLVFPFLLGFIFAFLLNIPLKKIECLLFRGKSFRAKRAVAFVLTLLLLLAALALLVFLVVPQLVQTVQLLSAQIPTYTDEIRRWLAPYEQYIPQLSQWIGEADVDWQSLANKLLTGLAGNGGSFLDSAFGFASSLFSGVANIGIAVVFAAYLLLGAGTLTAQLKAVLQAYLPARWYTSLNSFGQLASRTFSGFVGGQCTEAVIVGALFTLILWVGRFDYALLIGVLAGFTSLIPIFGGYIAIGVGGLLLLVSMGWVRAVVFVGLFLVVQQIDGDFIYPKVVGSQVGLSPVWMLVAVTLGGSLGGIVGILFFIPLASIFYTLLAQDTQRRLVKKGLRYVPAGPPAKKKQHRKIFEKIKNKFTKK